MGWAPDPTYVINPNNFGQGAIYGKPITYRTVPHYAPSASAAPVASTKPTATRSSVTTKKGSGSGTSKTAKASNIQRATAASKAQSTRGLPSGNWVSNPPPHAQTMHTATGSQPDTVKSKGLTRLGYLQPDDSFITAVGNTSTRWRFRFLYNPNEISISVRNNDDLVTIPTDLGPFQNTLVPGYQGVNFSLMLNRIPDMSDTSAKWYIGGLSSTDRDGILKRGTNYDIEFLYRAINGGPYKDNGFGDTTADIGAVLYQPVKLIFGPTMRFAGYIAQLNIDHKRFTTSMVPMLTQVDISLVRMTSYQPFINAATNPGANGVSAAGLAYNPSTGVSDPNVHPNSNPGNAASYYNFGQG